MYLILSSVPAGLLYVCNLYDVEKIYISFFKINWPLMRIMRMSYFNAKFQALVRLLHSCGPLHLLIFTMFKIILKAIVLILFSYFDYRIMISDVQLAVFANVLGVTIFLLVILYHYINANHAPQRWSLQMMDFCVFFLCWTISNLCFSIPVNATTVKFLNKQSCETNNPFFIFTLKWN